LAATNTGQGRVWQRVRTSLCLSLYGLYAPCVECTLTARYLWRARGATVAAVDL